MSHHPLNFGGLTPEYTNYQSSKIAILPVPFDLTSTWLKGADKGPEALIEASTHCELYDIETQSEVYTQGIYTASAVLAQSTTEMVEKVYRATRDLIAAKKFVVTLGGEHSISYGAIKAHAEAYGDFTLLQFDAHTDLRDEYEGDKYNHACVMARAMSCVKDIVSVGIRAVDSSELGNMEKTKIFFAEHLHGQPDWPEQVLKTLRPKVYVTFDLDAFDPSIMSATGTPEPGGLGWYEVLRMLKMVATERELLGCDVVELLPGENRAPEFLAAKLVYKILSYKFKA